MRDLKAPCLSRKLRAITSTIFPSFGWGPHQNREHYETANQNRIVKLAGTIIKPKLIKKFSLVCKSLCSKNSDISKNLKKIIPQNDKNQN